MRKVFIVDPNEDFSTILAGALRAQFQVEVYSDGTRALERIRGVHPDVVILDLLVPGIPGLELLKTIRAERLSPAVVVTSDFLSDFVVNALQRYQADYVIRKPCSISSITDLLEEILAGAETALPQAPEPDSAVSSILLALNMPSHRKGFRYCRMGILLCAEDPSRQVTKEIYPVIAKQFRTSNTAVEKAIRSAIDAAWKNRNDNIWRQYFPAAANGQIPKPTNTQFLFRLADAMEMGQQRIAR